MAKQKHKSFGIGPSVDGKRGLPYTNKGCFAGLESVNAKTVNGFFEKEEVAKGFVHGKIERTYDRFLLQGLQSLKE
ncbi:hypothetical protein [Paludifilum halophilum]|nr:hypothetical protein [Paludifilum halophilum]